MLISSVTIKREKNNLNNWVMIPTHKSTKVMLITATLVFATYMADMTLFFIIYIQMEFETGC